MASKETPEVKELRSQLRNPSVRKDDRLYLEAVQTVISNSTWGLDMTGLFTEMVMAGATSNLVQKKLVYLYLTTYAESNSELALLAVNTLCKDCKDHNPLVRRLALRALCSLRLVSLLQFTLDCVTCGLRDTCSVVRRTAVMGVLKLYQLDPQAVFENNLVSVLYALLRDKDPGVVSNSLAALTEILREEGGIVVSTGMTHHLLNRLNDFNEWTVCRVLSLLRCYEPSSEQELLDILNVLDSRLSYNNGGVVLETVALFLHLTQGHITLEREVHHRIKVPLLTVLCSRSPELTYTCLQQIQLLVRKHPGLWSREYKHFFCRCSDYPYVKVKKVKLLASVCTVSSAAVIVNELKEYSNDECALVGAKATEAIGSIGARLTLCSEFCVQALVQLLGTRASSDALVALSKTVMCSCDHSVGGMILPHLPSSVSSVSHPEGRAALVWILGEFGQDLRSSPYMLEEAVDNVSVEPSIVKLQLLTSVTKLFFNRAPECQDLLGRLLQHCIENVNDMDVRDRALLYYRLLHCDVQKAQRVVCSRKFIPKAGHMDYYHANVQLSDFNRLTSMYGTPASTFISQQCPYTTAQGPCSRENALHWDSGAISQEHGRDNHPEVDELSSAGNGHVPHILLDPSAQMSPGEFETLWLRLSPIKEFKVHLPQVPSTKELSNLLRSQFIMTMASSPSDSPVIKTFLYAQHVSTRHRFLVEVSIAVANRLLSFTLRCENNKQATPFVKHFFQTLGCHKRELPMLEWKMCEDVPTCMKSAKGVFFQDKLYLGGGFTGSSKADAIVYSYTPKLDMWKILPSSPLKWFAMAVFNDQIVLIGGKETKTLSMDYTNRLASWDKENTVWCYSLPPMLNRRSSPIAISQDSNLIVAGGNKGLLDYCIEVLNSNTKQWQCIPQLPLSCSSSLSTVFNGHWYFCRESDHSVFHASINDLLDSIGEYKCSEVETGLESGYNSLSCSQDSQGCVPQKSVHSSSKWDHYCKIQFTPTQISHIQSKLIAFNSQHDSGGHLAVFSYSPEISSWTHLGNLPAVCSSSSVIATPIGVFLVGGDSPRGQYSNKLFVATITTSN